MATVSNPHDNQRGPDRTPAGYHSAGGVPWPQPLVGTDKVAAADLRQAVIQAFPSGETMMGTIAEEWVKQGIQEGLQQGLPKGSGLAAEAAVAAAFWGIARMGGGAAG